MPKEKVGKFLVVFYSIWATANALLIYAIESCRLPASYLDYVSYFTPFILGLVALALLAKWKVDRAFILICGLVWMFAGTFAALYTMMQDKGVCLAVSSLSS